MKQKKSEFKLPYAGIDRYKTLTLLYGDQGDFSVVIKVTNPVKQYAADADSYSAYHHVLQNILKIMGENCMVQKQDVFSKNKYAPEMNKEFLQQKFNEHFANREYIAIQTFLTLTKKVKRDTFYVYNKKSLIDFEHQVLKVFDILQAAGFKPSYLNEDEINKQVIRVLNMDFSSDVLSKNNLLCEDDRIRSGPKVTKCISMVDIDSIELPEQIVSYSQRNDHHSLRDFPVDNFFFLYQVPGFETIIYNQVIEIPNQQTTLNKLELKRKRHKGVPDPANLLCVEDIDHLLIDVARDNQLIVNAHFSFIVSALEDRLDKAVNFIEAALFQQGIIPSKNAYNQLELFRCALPGNSVELKKYDLFLTTSNAAACFFFKESLLTDEDSSFLIRFTDRQGLPVAIDPSDLPMHTNRISNRNRFVLGPSGSGKSFFMNALVEQYMQYNVDVVIVDTGHSYSGLCSYFKGKYVTYSDHKPITMNPFSISEDEYNIEKKDFLSTLIGLLWKGAEGSISNVERDVIANVISAYYAQYFEPASDHLVITELNFNTFYEFALVKIPQIQEQERIPFELEEFRFILKKFYFGGEFGAILNEPAEQSLFSERFIVFEIDAIKEHRILFPIVTLIIMDVFIQKMRHREHRRKVLIIEEAWKAIASPLMAGYILYLYKTVRKFWGEAIVVTQELADILGNTVVKDSIISNSDTVCLLDQSKFKENYHEIGKLLSINAIEQRKIFTINQLDNTSRRGRFKEVYIRRGTTGEVYGVEVSLHQYLAYTTEKPEKRAVERYAESYGSCESGLNAFVSDLNASNLTLGQFVQKVNLDGLSSINDNEHFKTKS